MRANSTTRLCRNLRNNPTPATVALWSILRGRQIEGLRFRREHPLECYGKPYIVDFICLQKDLIIEVKATEDAEETPEVKERISNLNRAGYTVLLFWHRKIINDIEAVKLSITQQI